jgi:hypothetical protein
MVLIIFDISVLGWFGVYGTEYLPMINRILF